MKPLRKIIAKLTEIADEDDEGHEVDPLAFIVAARQLVAQAEMRAEGLHE